MSEMMTTEDFIKDHRKAAARVVKRVTRSKKASIAFLIRAGLLEKDGKRMAKPYRP
jgi:hypothetical protein